MSDRPLVVGIDVAATRPCVAVALQSSGHSGRLEVVAWHESVPASETGHRRHAVGPQGVSAARAVVAPRDLLDWIDVLSPQPLAVAVDAPQRLNRRLLQRDPHPHRSRVCDYELSRRRIGVYQVPSRADVHSEPERLPAWMKVGLDLFAKLRKRGFETPLDGALPGALGQPRAALEVYPYASFVVLLGRPLSRKTTREGLRLRVSILRREGVVWDRDGGDEYYDHDSLDALSAGLTAWRFVQGQSCGLGDGREGLIWLPVTCEKFNADFPAAGGGRL